MDTKEILQVVDVVSNEKGVEKSVIFEAIEAALASATRKRYGDDIEVRVAIDRATGSYDTFRRLKVFADDSTELENPEAELRLEDGLDVTPDAEVGALSGPQVRDVPPFVKDTPTGRSIAARDAIECRRLAGAIGANDGDDAALLDGQRHAIQRLRVAIEYVEVLDREHQPSASAPR